MHNQDGGTVSSALERAEQFWDTVGASTKSLTQQGGQNALLTISSLREKMSQALQEGVQGMRQPGAEAGSQPSPGQPHEVGPAQPPLERAEQLVDIAGHYLRQWSARSGLEIQRVTARMREGAEDILAEAQNLRQQRTP